MFTSLDAAQACPLQCSEGSPGKWTGEGRVHAPAVEVLVVTKFPATTIFVSYFDFMYDD